MKPDDFSDLERAKNLLIKTINWISPIIYKEIISRGIPVPKINYGRRLFTGIEKVEVIASCDPHDKGIYVNLTRVNRLFEEKNINLLGSMALTLLHEVKHYLDFISMNKEQLEECIRRYDDDPDYAEEEDREADVWAAEAFKRRSACITELKRIAKYNPQFNTRLAEILQGDVANNIT